MSAEETPNILILMVDSAKAAKLSCYGYDKPTTPNIDNCAKTGVRFESAITEAPWTLPSHLSLFSGLYPSEHGRSKGFDMANLGLSREIITLSELLSKKGYATGGFSSNPWVGRLTHLHDRHDLYIEEDMTTSSGSQIISAPGHLRAFKKMKLYSKANYASVMWGMPMPFRVSHEKLSDYLLKSFMKWVPTDGKKFYSFINLMNCHNPYYPPKDKIKKFLDKEKMLSPTQYNKQFILNSRGEVPLDNRLKENIHAYYDASLNNMDEQIGRVFSFLKEKNLYDNTLIFIFADHGKTLTEHDRKKFPLHYITDTNLHIPMIARHPKLFKPGIEKKHVQLLNVNQTILDAVGLENPNITRKGTSLQEIINSDMQNYAYSEVAIPYSGVIDKGQDYVRSIKKGPFKYIKSKNRGTMLFNLADDPTEEKDFSSTYPEMVEELSMELDEITSSFEWKDGKKHTEKSKLDDAIKKVKFDF